MQVQRWHWIGHSIIRSLGLFFLLGSAMAFAQPTTQAVPVSVTSPQTMRLQHSVNASGPLKANQAIQISAQTSGRIKALHFQDNDRVTLGTVLIELEDTILKAQWQQAMLHYQQATLDYQRAQKLVKQGSGIAYEQEKAETQRQLAQAEQTLIESQLAQLILKAPFSGQLGLSKVTVGEYITPGQPLVELIDFEPLKIDLKLPESFLPKLKLGQPIIAHIAAYPGQSFHGNLSAIDGQSDPITHHLTVRAVLDNTDLLRPGLYARVELILGVNEHALVLPETALIVEQASYYVYRIDADKAQKIPVKIGNTQQGMIEILEGVQPEDIIVNRGQMRLYPQALVQIIAD